MADIISRELSRFLADLEEAVTNVLDKHIAFNGEIADIYSPIGFYVSTCNGLTASFIEEGIELYPKVPTDWSTS